MKLKSIAITNMKCFDSVTLDLPSVTLIQGGNGAGKSSLLDILTYTFGRRIEGGNRGIDHAPEKMIRGGCEEGESIVTFEDGTAVRCVVRKEATTRMIRMAGESRWDRRSERIGQLVDAVGYDPLSLMDLDDKHFRETLERLFPPALDTAAIETALSKVEGIRARNGAPALDWLGECYDTIYRKRRDLNVAADSKEKHAAEIEAAAASPEDVSKELDAAIAESLHASKTVEALRSDGRDARARAEAAAQSEYTQAVEAAREKRDAQLAAVREELIARFRPLIDDAARHEAEATARVTQLRERSEAASRNSGLLESAKRATAAARELRRESEEMTALLDAVRDARAAAAPRVPGIRWLETGAPADAAGMPRAQWNTAKHIQQCLRIAVAVNAEAPFVVIDGAEAIVGKNRTALVQAAKKYADEHGFTFLIATALSGESENAPLSVTGA